MKKAISYFLALALGAGGVYYFALPNSKKVILREETRHNIEEINKSAVKKADDLVIYLDSKLNKRMPAEKNYPKINMNKLREGIVYDPLKPETIRKELPPFGEDAKSINDILAHKEFDESSFLVTAVNGDGYEWNHLIKFSEYARFKKRSHRTDSLDDMLRFVTYNNKEIREIASEITKDSKSKEESAKRILKFVQGQVVYDRTHEKTRADYVKYPIETLVERTGDCEDTSILAAALLKAEGLDVIFVRYIGIEDSHISPAVNGNFEGYKYEVNGIPYFHAETTVTKFLSKPSGREIGQLPLDLREGYLKREAFIVK